jgi:hypothetical protein
VAKHQDILSVSPAPSTDFSVFRTTDWAMSWQTQFSGTVAGFYAGGVQFFDQTNGILDVTVVLSSDGGVSWTPTNVPLPS